MNKKVCCDGDCNQGRDCPNRKEREMSDAGMFFVFMLLVLIIGIYVGYDE